MHNVLEPDERKEFLRRGFSRRNFGRLATLLTAGASLPFYNEPALAQLSMVSGMPPDAVKINANENPLGPCEEAREAMYEAVRGGGRYEYDQALRMAELYAQMEGVPTTHAAPFAGSSEPLHRAVMAFTSPNKPYVSADPTYEAGQAAARFIGADVKLVPLTRSYAHDVRAMIKASPNAGLYYVCNPNNPTGTLTPRSDIEYLLKNKPAGSVVLLDEAYLHLSPNAVACTDLAAKRNDLVVLRTFSKIYGMAGIRAAVAIGAPELLQKIAAYGAGALPLTAMRGAIASLKSKTVVPERRALIARTRESVFNYLERNRFTYIPSESNKFMVDVKRPGREVIEALARQKVYIGRVWPIWPTHVRVSIGTPEEMAKFQAAFSRVMGV